MGQREQLLGPNGADHATNLSCVPRSHSSLFVLPTTARKISSRMDQVEPLPDGAYARLGTRRLRVDGFVEGLRFIDGGKTILVRDNVGPDPANLLEGDRVSYWLFDVQSGKAINRLRSLANRADRRGLPRAAFAVSSDGKRLAEVGNSLADSKTRNSTISVKELATGNKVFELNDPFAWFSPCPILPRWQVAPGCRGITGRQR